MDPILSPADLVAAASAVGFAITYSLHPNHNGTKKVHDLILTKSLDAGVLETGQSLLRQVPRAPGASSYGVVSTTPFRTVGLQEFCDGQVTVHDVDPTYFDQVIFFTRQASDQLLR